MTSAGGAAHRDTNNWIFTGSTWLLAGKGLQMGCGFIFWVIAARAVSLTDFGVSAAATSAVILTTQLGILGTGATVIVRIGRGDEPARTLDDAFTILVLASVVAAAGYLAHAGVFGSTVLFMGHVAAFAAIFVVAAVSGSAVICLDQASIALRRAHGSVPRYAAGATASMGSLFALTLVGDVGALRVFLCWAVGNVVACAVGAVQLRAWAGYRFRPSLGSAAVLSTVRVGLPNQLITMTERLTPALVPLILAYVATPDMTARWYPAWMMAWAIFSAPLSAGLMQFADGVQNPTRLRSTLRRGVAWSLLAGGSIGVVLAAGAPVLLGIMGSEYAESSTTALRVLALGLVPITVVQAYNATCRALGRTTEAICLGLVTATIVCLATVVFGESGVAAVAWAWLATMSAAGVVSLGRLVTLTAPLPEGSVLAPTAGRSAP